MRYFGTPLASAVARTIVAAFAAAAFFGTAVAQAQTPPPAQSSPAPAASPAGQTNPAPGANPANPNPAGGQPSIPNTGPRTPAARPLSHLPVIDFVVTFTQPAYYSKSQAGTPATSYLRTQLPNYDPLDLGGTVRIPVTRKLNLLFDRITEGTVNQPLDCVRQPTVVCPADSRDIILQYHATYAFDRFIAIDAGESFRHRVTNSGASGVSAVPFPYSVSSTEHHFAYAGATYTTKPWRSLLNSSFALAETVDAQNVDHHVGVFCTAANKALGASCTGLAATQVGYLDERPGTDRYYETTQGITWIVPVDPKHGTSFVANERWGALNFYENAPFPYRWNSALTYQLNKRFSSGFTVSVRHSDFHAIPQGAPFAFPNAIHVGSYDVIGTFHLDTNTLFH